MRWKMTNDVAKTIQKGGGYIYGGFNRDSILHNKAASAYYSSHQEDDMYEAKEEYNNRQYKPEFIDRLIAINDIDCFMTEESFEELSQVMRENGYQFEVIKHNSARFYFANGNVELSALKHSKLTVKFNTNDVLSSLLKNCCYYVSVDVLYGDKSIQEIQKIVSKNMDFECNSLILDPFGNYTFAHDVKINNSFNDPMKKLAQLQQVINDIEKKKAVLLDTKNKGVYHYRIVKMIEKGFTIHTKNFSVIDYVITEEEKEAKCCLCLDEIANTKKHVKDIDCNARFCIPCYDRMISNNNYNAKCPLCRKLRVHTIRQENIIGSLAMIYPPNIPTIGDSSDEEN